MAALSKHYSSNRVFKAMNIVLVIMVVVLALLYVNERFSTAQNNDAAVIHAVGQHIILPNETPVIAILEDTEQLASKQHFFSHAVDGDYLLIYAQEKKAIIYRESDDIIVNVGPTSFVSSQEQN